MKLVEKDSRKEKLKTCLLKNKKADIRNHLRACEVSFLEFHTWLSKDKELRQAYQNYLYDEKSILLNQIKSIGLNEFTGSASALRICLEAVNDELLRLNEKDSIKKTSQEQPIEVWTVRKQEG